MSASSELLVTPLTSSMLIWKIKNFSDLLGMKNSTFLESKMFLFQLRDWTFSTETNAEANAKLLLYPVGHNRDCDGYLSVFLHFKPHGIQIINEGDCLELSIFQTKDPKNVNTQISQPIINGNCFTWRWSKFIKRSDLIDNKTTLLEEDTLVLSLVLRENLFGTQKDSNVSSLTAHQYESLYLSGDFSDVTIVIENKEIKAHKCILASKSKVFSAMLKHNMEEGNTSVIKILDIDYNVMKEFLLFLYCGKVPNIKNSARLLLPVSDKYDVIDLKKVCEKSLWDNRTVNNACELLCIADMYDCNELKYDIISYIVINIKEILSTTSFDEMSKSNNTLYKDILCELVKQRID